jgi:anti-anti-sigma regulatory factor
MAARASAGAKAAQHASEMDRLSTAAQHASDSATAVSRWAPSGRLTIDGAARIANDMPFAPTATAWEVDLSSVDRLDTAGCQLLLRARQDAERRGIAWRVVGCQTRIAESIRVLGCAGALGLDAQRPDADIEMQKQELP